MRFGRRRSSPEQLGQMCFIASVQSGQKVHSKLQMYASASWDKSQPHFSQTGFISNAM